MPTIKEAHRLLRQWGQNGFKGDRGYGDMTISEFGMRQGYTHDEVTYMMKLIWDEVNDAMQYIKSFCNNHTHYIGQPIGPTSPPSSP